MNTEKEMLKRLELLGDVIMTLLAFACAYVIKDSRLLPDAFAGLVSTHSYSLLLLLITIIWYVMFGFVHNRVGNDSNILSSISIKVFKGTTASIIIMILFMYVLKITDISRLFIFFFYFLDLIFLCLYRWAISHFKYSRRKKVFFHRQILILGSWITAREIIQMINDHPGTDIKIVGCLDISQDDVGKTVCSGVKVIGTIDDLHNILLSKVIDEVLITMPLNKIENSDWLISFINTFGITIRIIPYWYIRKYIAIEKNSSSVEVDNFLLEPALIINTFQKNEDSLLIKSMIDYFIAISVLIISFPLFIIFPIFIRLFSKGPVFFRQTRCGLYGRTFTVFKFRTMIEGADEKIDELSSFNEADGPVFKMKDDPRIIPYIGKFLRKSGLDELPQFINVLRGEMSVVGPRPPVPSEVAKYELWQRRRLSMKPGITCFWQVKSDRNDLAFDDWMKMDLDYIDRWSLWLDLLLMLKTVPVILRGQGR